MATQDQLPDLDKFFNTVKEAHNMHDCWEMLEKDPRYANAVDVYGNTPLYYACKFGWMIWL